MVAQQRALERNIVKYAWYKVVTKRLYLPLIAIQLVNEGKVSIEDIALIAIITSIVQFVLQLPTGYFADKFGNKRAIVIGALIAFPSPLFYIFMPNFFGGLMASLLFFGGWAFQSGAIEAFIHDTTIALKREHEYTKIMGRSQSFGLIGNVILIALVPATYSINHALPFLLGFLSLGAMVLLGLSMASPNLPQEAHKPRKDPFAAMRIVVTSQTILLFLFAGFLAGVGNKTGEYTTLLYQSVGIAAALFGTIQAISSLLGALLGFVVHWFDKVTPTKFYFIDLTIVSVLLIAMGISKNPAVVIAATVAFGAYYRIRLIVIQSKLLASIQHHYKATLLSALGIFTPLGEILSVTLLAKLASHLGYSSGYLYFGLAVLAVSLVLWSIMTIVLTRAQRKAI